MSETPRTVRLRTLPEVGARIPGFVPRAVFAVVGILLCLDRYQLGFLAIVGFILTAAAVAFPRFLTAWALILLLAASQLATHPSPLDGRFFVLLAGLHLLHVLAAQMLALPVRGWIQVTAFRRPFLRFLAIQLPVQAVAVLALVLLAPTGDTGIAVPILGIVGAIALALVTLLLIVPLLREKSE